MRTVATMFVAVLCIALLSCTRRPAVDQQLDTAIEAGDTNYLQNYVISGGDINRLVLPARGQQIAAPLLYYAILRSQREVVDFLLRNGADPNKPDASGHRPLKWAIGAGSADVAQEIRTQILQRLLEAGANPNLKDLTPYGYTPLLSATASGQIASIRILLKAGANVNATNMFGQTALHLASSAEVVRVLLDAGADPTVRDIDDKTPADEALAENRLGVLSVLTNSTTQINRPERTHPAKSP